MEKMEKQVAAGSFTADDIINPVALATKLQAGDHPFGPYLLGKFSSLGREALAKLGAQGADSKELAELLAKELNDIVAGGQSLYQPAPVNGTKLRKSTKKLLKKPRHGDELVRLNVLLVQDVFPAELDHDSCELVDVVKKNRVEFRIYKERRKLQTTWNESFKITFPATNGKTSTHARSLDEAYVEIEGLVDKILSGQVPITKHESKQRDSKAKAYDEVAAEVAKVGKTSAKDILEFIQAAVKVQLLLGLARPLLEFVIYAIELMVKPVKQQFIQACVEKYCDFIDGRRDVDRRHRRRQKAQIRKFGAAMPVWIHSRRLKENPPQNGSLEQPRPADFHADQIEANDIQAWLNSSSNGWRSRRGTLDEVRAFMVYCRDVLHAIPPGLKTAAHSVPRPKPDSDAEPIPAPVLSWRNVWRMLINLRDLESVWFYGLAVFVGLHQTEILRLVWEYDIKWDGGFPTQVFIASGKGKDKHGNRLGVWIDIREPLRSILALGQGRTGKIIRRKNLRQEKLTRLANLLGIVWDESIMRHTFVSNLFGLGLSYEEVARQARHTVTVLKRHYYAPIAKSDAQQFFSLPIDILWIANLPWQLRNWDWNTLNEFVVGSDNTASIQPGAVVPTVPVVRTRISRRRQKPIAWPSDLELQVALWDRSQEQIAHELHCRQTTVSSYAKKRGLVSPKSDYLVRLKNNLPVEIPEAVLKARAAQAALESATPKVDGGTVAKASPGASPNGNSPEQMGKPEQKNSNSADHTQQPES